MAIQQISIIGIVISASAMIFTACWLAKPITQMVQKSKFGEAISRLCVIGLVSSSFGACWGCGIGAMSEEFLGDAFTSSVGGLSFGGIVFCALAIVALGGSSVGAVVGYFIWRDRMNFTYPSVLFSVLSPSIMMFLWIKFISGPLPVSDLYIIQALSILGCVVALVLIN
ncbi:MAG: hypothetical protein KDA84_29915, partial [Planctomycetaceae bacterium]|nr:hypothetical protein [Planctomycetaceae bacterium]